MSLSIDPYSIVKDFLGRKREQKDLDALKGKYLRVVTGSENHLGRLSRFDHIGKSLTIVLQDREGNVSIPFDSVQSMRIVNSKLILDELLSTISYDEKRSIHLSWIVDAAQPVKDGAKKWFNEEVAHLRHEINILMTLFPHRSYDSLEIELNSIDQDFQGSIAMLDEILLMVEQKKATTIGEIYHTSKKIEKPSAEDRPDILIALGGLFLSAHNLESLMNKVNSVVASITDTVTITRIIQDENRI